MRKILCVCLLLLFILPLSAVASTSNDSEYKEVDLQYLASHMEEFYGQKVRTNGTVSLMTSAHMYEDFLLEKTVPVVVRPSLAIPSEGAFIEIYGTINHTNLEGGFYYLNADNYIEEDAAPEFQQFLIMPLFMAATLLTLIAYKKPKKNKTESV
jgi:hypothetical protein